MIRYLTLSILIHVLIFQYHFDKDKEKTQQQEYKINIKIEKKLAKALNENNIINKKKKYILSDKTYTSQQKENKFNFSDFNNAIMNNIGITKSNSIKTPKEYANSDITSYNTIRYVFYSFFKRVHTQIGNNWKLDFQYLKNKRLITTLLVKIDKKGNIKDLKIIKSSNNKYYDQTTITAFLNAAPFINPPTKLFKNQSFAKFEWSFILN